MTEITAAHTAGASSDGGGKGMMNRLRTLRAKVHKQEANAPGGVVVDRGLFVKEQTTHHAMDRRANRKRGTESEKVTLDGELMKQYANFMTGYVRNLNRLVADHSSTLDAFNSPWEKRLMQILSTGKEPDPTKIKNFLQQPEGMILATIIMEEQTTLTLSALGWDHEPVDGSAGEQSMPGNLLVNVGRKGIVSQGAGRLLRRTGIVGEAATVGAAVGIGAKLGSLIDTISPGEVKDFISSIASGVTPAMAGGALAGAAGLAFARRFFNPDGNVDLRVCAEGLNLVKANPALAHYVRMMTGVDANDFIVEEFAGMRAVRRDPNQPSLQTKNIPDIQRQVIANLQTRRAFYEKFGYPGFKRGAMFEQLLTRDNTDGRQQWPTRWSERIDELKYQLNPNYANLTPAQQREVFMDARTHVIHEYIQEIVDQQVIQNPEANRPKVKTSLAEKSRKLKETDKDTWKKDHEELERQARVDKEYLEGVKKELSGKKDAPPVLEGQTPPMSRKQAKTELDDALKELKDYNPAARRDEIETSYIPPLLTQIRAAEVNIETLRTDLQTEQENIRNNVGLGNYQKTVIAKNGTPHIVPMEKSEIYEAIKKDYDTQVARFNAEIKELKTRIADLRRIGANIDTKQEQLEKLGGVEHSKFAQDSQNDLDNIITATAGGAARNVITVADLANLSISDVELIQRINRAHRARNAGRPNEAWAEGENIVEANRQRLVRARIEARLRQTANYYFPLAEGRLQRFRVATTFSEAQIAASSLTDLRDQMRALFTSRPGVFPDPAGYSDPDLQLVIDAAKARGEFRKALVQDNIEGLTIREQTEGRIKNNYEAGENATRVELALDLLNRHGEILSSTTGEEFNLEDIVDPQLAQRNDPDLNQEERRIVAHGSGVPSGYYRTMEFLFGHKSKTDSNEYFTKIQTVLSPQRFLELVNDGIVNGDLHLELGGMIPAPNIAHLFAQMELAYYDHTITERSIRRLATFLIDRLAQEARSLT